MNGRIPAACLAAFLALPRAGGLEAQEIVIPDAVACPDCRIGMARIVAVGDTTGPGALGEYGSLRWYPDDEYFVRTAVQAGTILVFGPDGRYRRSIGRRGEGPGEFRSPDAYHVQHDSVWVFDNTGRVTMLVPGTDRPWEARTWNVPFAPYDAIRLGDGLHVYTTVARLPQLIGIPFHVVDEARGTILRSFGNPGGACDPLDPYGARRSIAPSGEAEFWAAHMNEYVIEKWTVDGERVHRIERDAPWFEPWQGTFELERVAPPPPILHGVIEDSAGILWVFHRVADREWAPQPPAETRGGKPEPR